jgi:hypothetical protein
MTLEASDFSVPILESFQTKSEEWKYEEEVRIIGPAESFTESDGRSYVPIDAEVIDCVIFGSRISTSLREEILELLRSNPALSHVRKLQAEVDPDRFVIAIKPAD